MEKKYQITKGPSKEELIAALLNENENVHIELNNNDKLICAVTSISADIDIETLGRREDGRESWVISGWVRKLRRDSILRPSCDQFTAYFNTKRSNGRIIIS